MLNRSAGAMAIAMALCLFTSVIFLGGVNSYFAAPTVILAALLSVWCSFLTAFRGTRTSQHSWLTVAVVSFVGYAFIRYRWSLPEHEAREELISILVAVSVYLLAGRTLKDRQTRSIFIYGLMLLAILESVYGAWQAFSKATTVLGWERPETYDGRGSGTYICPNHLAGLLEMALGLVVARAVFLSSENKSVEKSAILKVFTIYGAVMIAGGLVVTLSRGGWFAGVIGLVALPFVGGSVFKKLIPKLLIIGAILLCAGGFMWNVDSVRNYLLKTVAIDIGKQQVTIGDPSLGGRIHMWKGTLPLIRDHPAFGTGIGNWKWEFQKHHNPQIFSFPEYTHNDYLNLASDYGLVGVALLLFVFVTFFIHASKIVRTSKSNEEKAFTIGAMAAVISILVHSFFDFNLHILANSTLLAAIMGAAAAIPSKAASEKSAGSGYPARFGIAIALVAITLLLACLYVPTLRGYHECEKGNAAKGELAYSDALAHYEASVSIDPGFAKPLIRAGDILKDQAAWRLGPAKQQEKKELATKAVDYYLRALALNPKYAEVWIRKGQAEAMAGDNVSALSSFQKAIEIAPVNAYAHFVLGRFYSDQGNELKALEAFQKANNYYFHNEPMFFMNAVEAEERIRSKQQMQP